MKNFLSIIAIVLILLSFMTLGMGIHKLTKYENPDEESYLDDDDFVNAYVQGDAYNYIINSERTTGFFVLSGSSFIAAIGLIIITQLQSLLSLNKKKNDNIVQTVDESVTS